MSPSLPLSLIVVQIWGRYLTTLSIGIGYVVDVIWSKMLSLLVFQHRGITCTIQLKMRRENVNKRLTSEKCELLLPNALSFFKCVRTIWSWGLNIYIACIGRDRLFPMPKGPPRRPKSCRYCKSNRWSRTPLKAATRSQTLRKMRKKIRVIQNVDMPMRSI